MAGKQQQATQQHFPCQQCGADLTYDIGIERLSCEYCGHDNEIVIEPTVIHEYDFHHALDALERSKLRPMDNTEVIKCPNCAATFELDENKHAGDCPFCGTPVVTGTEQARLFQPKSLLPFAVTEQQARDSFDRWIKGLWFAPSALKDKAKRDEKLLGIYVPYWTYDSKTHSSYQGERGTVYYERQLVTVRVNGKLQQQVRNIPKIRWSPARGRVRLAFDDVLVGATKTLPRKILDRIQPWDLDRLVPYQEAYLSGFKSEIYQIDLDEGFEQARQIMNHRIHNAIRRDIGGDQQRIHHVDTQHQDTSFKHLLLPVWSAAFRYNGQTYRFVINGRNGKTQGERPYSMVKIAFAILAGAIALGGAMYVLEKSGALDTMLQEQTIYMQDGYYYN